MARASGDPITQARHRVRVVREDLELIEADIAREGADGRFAVAHFESARHRAAWLRGMLARAELVLRAERLRAVNARMDRIRRPPVERRPPPVQLGLFAAAELDDELPEADPADVVEVPEGARVLYLPRPTCPTQTRAHLIAGLGGAA